MNSLGLMEIIFYGDLCHPPAPRPEIILQKIDRRVSVIFLLIIFSLLLAIGFLIAFIWSVRNGQYEDEYTPSVRMLFDDEPNSQESPSIKDL